MKLPLKIQAPELARHIQTLRVEERRAVDMDVRAAITAVLDALHRDGEVTRALARLREYGWSVAVHNDYRLDGKPMTFWLFTHPGGRWAKGEGATDAEALDAVFEMVMHGAQDEP